jgi:hypothetical protein
MTDPSYNKFGTKSDQIRVTAVSVTATTATNNKRKRILPQVACENCGKIMRQDSYAKHVHFSRLGNPLSKRRLKDGENKRNLSNPYTYL